MVATGGYDANRELIATYEALPGWKPQSITSEGDGLALGTEVGAAVRGPDGPGAP